MQQYLHVPRVGRSDFRVRRFVYKWSFLIFAVLEDGPKRFNEIKRLIGDSAFSRRIFEIWNGTATYREVYPVSPPKVEYQLTEIGTSILRPIHQFMSWALEVYPKIQKARKKYDRVASQRG